MRVDVVDEVEGFEQLHQEWDAAALASLDPNVFLTWGWLRTWWRHFGEGSADARLHLVVMRDDEGIVAAAPLFKATSRVGPLRSTTLRQIGYDAGDYGGILLVRRHDEAVDALLAHCTAKLRGHAAGDRGLEIPLGSRRRSHPVRDDGGLGHVGGREHGAHARQLERPLGVDPDQPGMGVAGSVGGQTRSDTAPLPSRGWPASPRGG